MISFRQYWILRYFVDHPGKTCPNLVTWVSAIPPAIRKQLNLDGDYSALWGVVNRLVDHGWLEKQEHEASEKLWMYTPTERGAALEQTIRRFFTTFPL